MYVHWVFNDDHFIVLIMLYNLSFKKAYMCPLTALKRNL